MDLLTITAALIVGQPPLLSNPFDADKARAVQAEWAKDLNTPVELANSIGMALVLIPPGRFEMGGNGSKYRVSLKIPYYIGRTEVTLGQYRRFKANHRVDNAGDEFNADDRPAAMVSWDDARAFCQWLSERPEEKSAGRIYSLPTEAQWEWAARAGSNAVRPFGDEKTDKGLTEHAWFNHTYTPNPKSESEDRGRQPVAKLKPNAWGLYDTLGNVWEWCDDRRIDNATGEERQPTMRGGSWRSGGFHCTVIAHDPGAPTMRGDNIGFRIACRIVER